MVAVRRLAEELWRAAPPKIEGGSPARAQWLSDVLAIQQACWEAGVGEEFVSAMNGAPVESPVAPTAEVALPALFTGLNAAALIAIETRVRNLGGDPTLDIAADGLLNPDEPDGYYRALADRGWLVGFVRQIRELIER